MKAFTLVELLVAMAIIGMLGGLGIQAMITYRNNVVFQQAENDFINFIQTTINLSRNSVSYNGNIYDAYGIRIADDNYSRLVCNKTNTIVSQDSFECDVIEENIKPASFTDVIIEVSDIANCSTLIFKRLSSETISLASQNLLLVSTNITNCDYTLQGLSGLTNTVEFNLSSNTVNY